MSPRHFSGSHTEYAEYGMSVHDQQKAPDPKGAHGRRAILEIVIIGACLCLLFFRYLLAPEPPPPGGYNAAILADLKNSHELLNK